MLSLFPFGVCMERPRQMSERTASLAQVEGGATIDINISAPNDNAEIVGARSRDRYSLIRN